LKSEDPVSVAGTQYILEICFVGTNYEGWQSQPSGQTIQDKLNTAVRTCLGDAQIKTRGCSRTDSGVHAKQIFATFRTRSLIENAHVFLRSMRALLPPDIAVKRLGLPDDAFHIVKSPVKKIYRYQIWNGKAYIDPFLRPYIWHVPSALEISAMQEALSAFVGVHDFTSFAASDGAAQTKTREIFSFELEQQSELLTYTVIGAGFLKQMVRNLVGTVVEVGLGRFDASAMTSILLEKDRPKAGRTAPASGLSLEEVHLRAKDSDKIRWL